MIGSFINPIMKKAYLLGISLFEEKDQIELWESSSETEVERVIMAVDRQVLGNAYVMESERLTIRESHMRSGEISVRDFVREVALSELYREGFFDNCPRYRSIELNLKPLLGRAPESYEKMRTHSKIWDAGGWSAEIESYIDSSEYEEAFGENKVPFNRGYKTQSGASSSDKSSWAGTRYSMCSARAMGTAQNTSRLNRGMVLNKYT